VQLSAIPQQEKGFEHIFSQKIHFLLYTSRFWLSLTKIDNVAIRIAVVRKIISKYELLASLVVFMCQSSDFFGVKNKNSLSFASFAPAWPMIKGRVLLCLQYILLHKNP